MILDRMNAVVSSTPLMHTAWTILEAANDLGTMQRSRPVDELLTRRFVARQRYNPT
jgi:hypothetical protein